jgi:hypothetical protein
MEIIEKLENTDSERVKIEFIQLMKEYLAPAFGSMSKRDLDILLFTKLQKLQVFDENPEIYDLVSQLRVTRSKARNLLYESKLRQTTPTQLDNELKLIIQNPIFLKENDKIGIEIQNPFLIDHLRVKLKRLKHITDGSFSPELVRLTTDAYISLFDDLLPENSKNEIVKAFVQIGAKADKRFKGLMKGALKKIGTKIADDAGGEIAESVSDYLGPVISGTIDLVTERFRGFFEDEENEE